MASVVRIQVFSIMQSWGGCGEFLHVTDHAPMKLVKHNTCWIERRRFPKAGSVGSDVGMYHQALTGILNLDCRYSVVESSSFVSIHFREVFSHPNISFFTCVRSINIKYGRLFLLQISLIINTFTDFFKHLFIGRSWGHSTISIG